MLPSSIAKNPIEYTKAAELATLKERDRKRCRSNTGSGWRDERHRKIAHERHREHKADDHCARSPQPHVGPSEMASTSPARATLSSATPR